ARTAQVVSRRSALCIRGVVPRQRRCNGPPARGVFVAEYRLPGPGRRSDCANVDAKALPDYVARSFEAGIRPSPDEPDPSERKSLASRRFLRSAGGPARTRKVLRPTEALRPDGTRLHEARVDADSQPAHPQAAP